MERTLQVAESEATTTADIAKTANNGNDRARTGGPVSLFSEEEARGFRKRWEQVQTEFVDEPRASVEKADELVASTIKRLAEVFADERTRLEHEWAQGENMSTEDLRQALRKYRSFFDRMLAV
ncbi:MAG TPA: hypothetical protein VNV82_22470 [Bryobacteraceae bacterium]|jgi:hypothetical protein|nr:hypothetical protein [Bryobacteraceae bacterium]